MIWTVLVNGFKDVFFIDEKHPVFSLLIKSNIDIKSPQVRDYEILEKNLLMNLSDITLVVLETAINEKKVVYERGEKVEILTQESIRKIKGCRIL